MLQPLGSSDIKDLAIGIVRCIIKKELDEKISAWKNGKAIVNIYDVARCGYRYKLSLDNPEPTVSDDGKEDVFRRYVINYGIINVAKRVYEDDGIEIEKSLSHVLKVDDREVELVGICDIFLPKVGEIVLVRHAKELSHAKPMGHHVEQAVVLQWLAYKNGIPAEPRILYYIGFGREFREFRIDTNIMRSKALVKEFEERLVNRLRLILNGEGPFYSWDCKVCPYGNSCAIKSGTPKANSLVSDGEWVWYEDTLLTRTMETIRMLIKKDIEFAESNKGGAGKDNSLRISVTKLTGCPVKFWLSALVPYASILSRLSRRVLRGEIVHSGITYILSRFGDVKQYCTDIKVGGRCVGGIEVEKRLSKHFNVYQYNVEVSGRADVVLYHEDGENAVFELKTVECGTRAEDSVSARPYHEEQLKIYLNMLGNTKGKLVYITEVEVKTGNGKARMLLKFDELEVVGPAGDDHIKSRIEDVIMVMKGLANVDEIVEKHGGLCKMCEFRDLCVYRTSAKKGTHKSEKTV